MVFAGAKKGEGEVDFGCAFRVYSRYRLDTLGQNSHLGHFFFRHCFIASVQNLQLPLFQGSKSYCTYTMYYRSSFRCNFVRPRSSYKKSHVGKRRNEKGAPSSLRSPSFGERKEREDEGKRGFILCDESSTLWGEIRRRSAGHCFAPA